MCIFTGAGHNKGIKVFSSLILLNIISFVWPMTMKIAFVKSWLSQYYFIVNKCIVHTKNFKEESGNKNNKIYWKKKKRNRKND